MDFKIKRDESEQPEHAEETAGKGKQNILLVVLLLLVGGFAYIYFFTGLIKPEEKPPAAATPAPQAVKKMPLPSRDGDAAKGDAAPAAPDKKDAPAAKPEPKKPAETSVAAAEPKPEAKKPEPAKPAASPQEKKVAVPEKKDTPKPAAAAAKPEEKKPAAPPAKKEATAKPAAPAKEGDKKVADPKKQEPAKTAKAPAAVPDKKPVAADKKEGDTARSAPTGPWTVLVGNYVLEDAMAPDMAKVRKAGVEAKVGPGPRKKTTMNRLLYGEYTDRPTADAELQKLRRHTSDAFVIDQKGKYLVYAGSYLLDARASSEMERLSAAGFRLTMKRAEVGVPSRSLTAGTYKDRKSADSVLKKLKDAGLKATLTR